MLPSTREALAAIMRADPSIDAATRAAVLKAGSAPATDRPPTDILLRVPQVAEILGRTPRSVHMLAQRGVLRKVTFPGSTRSAGFRRSDVERLIATEPEGGAQ